MRRSVSVTAGALRVQLSGSDGLLSGPMRRLFLSLFLGFGSAFVAWAAWFAVEGLESSLIAELTRHEFLVLAAAVSLAIALVSMHRKIESGPTILAATGGCALFWNLESFPDDLGYTSQYWSAVVLTSAVSMVLAASLNGQYLSRDRRH